MTSGENPLGEIGVTRPPPPRSSRQLALPMRLMGLRASRWEIPARRSRAPYAKSRKLFEGTRIRSMRVYDGNEAAV